MMWMGSSLVVGAGVDTLTSGQIIVLVIEGLISLVLLAAVPWAVLVERRLSRIEAILSSRRSVEKEHDEIFARIRALELAMARCGQCSDQTKRAERL